MPESALRAAAESHGADNPMTRLGMYVPTRGEVATRAADDLLYILDFWFGESPTELIPTSDQIRQVREVLLQRRDADAKGVRDLVDLCDQYLRPDENVGFTH